MLLSNRWWIAGLLAAGFAPLVSAREAIPVVDAGFENPPLFPCDFSGDVPGWSLPGFDTGVWRILPCYAIDYPGGAPEGLQVAYINTFSPGSLLQDLPATLLPDTEYTLLVDVGRRAQCCPMVSDAVEVRTGSDVIAEDRGALDPAPGTFETSIITFDVPSDHPLIGAGLSVRLARVGQGQPNFDHVRFFEGLDDCNGNGVHDAIDIARGRSLDRNNNDVPDECNPPACPADLTSDGVVDGADLGQLLLAWDTDDGDSDLNNDGTVNGADLGELLLAWGGEDMLADLNADLKVDGADLGQLLLAWGDCPLG
jgi:hypothetical protein